MKKSQIDSYTSEELKQLPDESDWEANAAMTEEEIRVAIESDPDDASVDVEWLRSHKITPPEEYVDMFVATRDSQGNLKMNRISKWLLGKGDLVTIVDETGKSYQVRIEPEAEGSPGIKQSLK